MRRSVIAVLTYLSLLASIGSFMISALPLLDCTTCTARNQAEQKPGDMSVTQAEPTRRQYAQLSREWLIAVCIWVIVGGMTGITIIRLLRKER
jgi:hypothetical protein